MKQVCDQFGIPYETLRFYCNEGLIPNVTRDKNNYRVFDERNVNWLKSLQCLKKCGMSIKDIKRYLRLCMEGASSIPERKQMLDVQKDILLDRINEIHECIDFIDGKQEFYTGVLNGDIEYTSNLIGTEARMLVIREAITDEFDKTMEFYYDLIDSMQGAEYKPGWKKGVYPTEMFIQDSIKNAEMIIGVNDNHLISAMVMNHDYADGYENVKWQVNAKKDEIIVIHALGISSAYQGQGIAKQMVAYAVKNSKDKNLKSIRLDVLGTNLPAQRLYTAMGFRYIDTIKLFYEDTGLTDFLLYELIL